jgi:glycosyltransferase involved in cell wall biosynthesis
METVAIAIPFYRNVDYLRGAVASVVAQSSGDWRLVVVDDSGALERESAVHEAVTAFGDARIRYERNPATLGMVPNWNRCLDLAELAGAPLVTLLHGDDRLLPGYVATLQRLAAAHPEAVALHCGAEIIGPSGRRTVSVPDLVKGLIAPRGAAETVLRGEPGASALMRGNFIMCPTLCFRSALLAGRRFEPGWEQVQDLELTVRLLMEGEVIVGTPAIAYAYRRHPESATHLQSANRLRFDEEFRLFDLVATRAAELGWSGTARVARRKRIVKLHLLYRALADLVRLHPARAADTLRYLFRARRRRWR